MNENNREEYKEYAFRTKRIENDYNNQSNQKILLKYDVNSNDNENNDKNENKENINSYNNMDKLNRTEFNNKNQNSLFIDSFNISNDNINNKYPNFQSSLQLYPKEDIEIPPIKYYNFIFNIGTPSN